MPLDPFQPAGPPLPAELLHELHALVARPVVARVVTPVGPMALLRGFLDRVQVIDDDVVHLCFDDHPRGSRVVLTADGLRHLRRDSDCPQRLTVAYQHGHLSVRDMSTQARLSSWRRQIEAARREPDRTARFSTLRLLEQLLIEEARDADETLAEVLYDVLADLQRLLRQNQPWTDDTPLEDENGPDEPV